MLPLCPLSPLPQVRKPIVEKMRRDRINSSIEQLRIILEKEFHEQEPNSKLEKADILEMTVSFLRQQLQSGLCHSSYNQGYSPCWRDSLHVPSSRPQHRGLCRSSAGSPAAEPDAPSVPESKQLLLSLLHTQAHHTTGQQQQKHRVEALVETH